MTATEPKMEEESGAPACQVATALQARKVKENNLLQWEEEGEKHQKRGNRFDPYANPTKRYRAFITNIPFDVKWQSLKDLVKEKGNGTGGWVGSEGWCVIFSVPNSLAIFCQWKLFWVEHVFSPGLRAKPPPYPPYLFSFFLWSCTCVSNGGILYDPLAYEWFHWLSMVNRASIKLEGSLFVRELRKFFEFFLLGGRNFFLFPFCFKILAGR